MKQIPKEFETTPVVYAVEKNYQIMVPVSCETVMWVEVGSKRFYDETNGILRSKCTTHRMTVPMALLDAAEQYTVCYRIITDRKPYYTESGELQTYVSSFHPVRGDTLRFYHISDAHNKVENPVVAAKNCGNELDFLILNGDIPNHGDEIEYFKNIHIIASEITMGEIPVVFSRGNHDMRGKYAEFLCDHTPTDNGKSYYTFRLGSLWGILLDCGEDKLDDQIEYGNTICCAEFRQRQTAFIHDVIANAKNEYLAEGVVNRIVISHVPFTQSFAPLFDIEKDTYSEWARLLREQIKPQLMLCGHVHYCDINPTGGERDVKGQPCVMITASQPAKDQFIGGFFALRADTCQVKFTDNHGTILREETLVI